MSINASGRILVVTKTKARIKILRENGKDEATRTLTLYNNPKRPSSDNQQISGISANAYNLVNGKVVKTGMSSKYVFEKQVSDKRKEVKFTVPEVKVGTIIEYKYEISAPLDFPTWYAQSDIPVLSAHCMVEYAKCFGITFNQTGYCEVKTHREDLTNMTMIGSGGAYQTEGVRLDFQAWNLPAIKDEGLVANPMKYATQISFEINSVNIPGVVYQNYALKWSDVMEQLYTEGEYSKYLKMKNPYADAMAGLQLDGKKNVEKANIIYAFVKNKLKWDGDYRLACDDPNDAVKKGSGDNIQLNFIIMSMLRDAGVQCSPMLIKRRSDGPLIYTLPTLDDLSSFIVAFADEEGNLYFLDGSTEYGGVNCLPLDFLGDGILMNEAIAKDPQLEYHMYLLNGNDTRSVYAARITPDGELQGSRRNVYQGLIAYLEKNSFHNAKDSTEFVTDMAKKDNIEITSYKPRLFDATGFSCSDNMRFTKTLDHTADRIYVNPLVLPDEHTDHFTSETRSYPVELPCMQNTYITSNIVIPDGYVVEEKPAPQTISMPNGELAAKINITVEGNVIKTEYAQEVSTSLILPGDYKDLREYWTKLLSLSNLSVVLKKAQ